MTQVTSSIEKNILSQTRQYSLLTKGIKIRLVMMTVLFFNLHRMINL